MTTVRASKPLHALLPDSATTSFLDCLSKVLDQFTFARIAQAGIVTGGRYLLVGPASGSTMRWLADTARPEGQIQAISTADRLPTGDFDLIYGRLALAHVRKPSQMLSRLAEGLTPGGVLVIEECLWSSKVLASANPDASTTFERYQHALATVLAAHGNDIGWAERVPAAMLSAGLLGVEVAAHARSWPGGSPGAKLHIILATELRDQLTTAGMDTGSLDELRTCLADPRLLLLGNTAISTIGRRRRLGISSRTAGQPA